MTFRYTFGFWEFNNSCFISLNPSLTAVLLISPVSYVKTFTSSRLKFICIILTCLKIDDFAILCFISEHLFPFRFDYFWDTGRRIYFRSYLLCLNRDDFGHSFLNSKRYIVAFLFIFEKSKKSGVFVVFKQMKMWKALFAWYSSAVKQRALSFSSGISDIYSNIFLWKNGSCCCYVKKIFINICHRSVTFSSATYINLVSHPHIFCFLLNCDIWFA